MVFGWARTADAIVAPLATDLKPGVCDAPLRVCGACCRCPVERMAFGAVKAALCSLAVRPVPVRRERRRYGALHYR